jgi:hypothetical protein
MAIVPLDPDGRFCVFRSTAVHSIVDVAAYFGADGEPLWFSPAAPERLTDSRLDGACLPEQECRPGAVPAMGVHTVPTDSESARIVNLTVVDARGPGFAQVGRCEDVGPASEFSTINVMNAGARANLALVPAGTSGTCAFTLTQSNLIVDELGRLTDGEGLGWSLAPGRRAIDTRECDDQWCDGRPAAGTIVPVDLDTDAPAAAIAITVTDTRGPGLRDRRPLRRPPLRRCRAHLERQLRGGHHHDGAGGRGARPGRDVRVHARPGAPDHRRPGRAHRRA